MVRLFSIRKELASRSAEKKGEGFPRSGACYGAKKRMVLGLREKKESSSEKKRFMKASPSLSAEMRQLGDTLHRIGKRGGLPSSCEKRRKSHVSSITFGKGRRRALTFLAGRKRARKGNM